MSKRQTLLLLAISLLLPFAENANANAFIQQPPPPFAQVDNAQAPPGLAANQATWSPVVIQNAPRALTAHVLKSPGGGFQEVLGVIQNSSTPIQLPFQFQTLNGNSWASFWDLSQITSLTIAGLAINTLHVADGPFPDNNVTQSYVAMAGNWKQFPPLQKFVELVFQSTRSFMAQGISGFVTTGFWAEFRYQNLPNRTDIVKLVSGFDGFDQGSLQDFVSCETSFAGIQVFGCNGQVPGGFNVSGARIPLNGNIQNLFTLFNGSSPLVNPVPPLDVGEIEIDLTFTVNAFKKPNPLFADSNVVGAEGSVATPGPLPLLGCGAFFGFSRKLRRRIKVSQYE